LFGAQGNAHARQTPVFSDGLSDLCRMGRALIRWESAADLRRIKGRLIPIQKKNHCQIKAVRQHRVPTGCYKFYKCRLKGFQTAFGMNMMAFI
jgi:hypothetical protein